MDNDPGSVVGDATDEVLRDDVVVHSVRAVA